MLFALLAVLQAPLPGPTPEPVAVYNGRSQALSVTIPRLEAEI
jgi:hypothetical protein